MAIKVGNSKASITISGADQKIVLDLMDKASLGVLAEIEREIEKIYQDAYAEWPKPGDPLYDSSRSRQGARKVTQARTGIRPWIPPRTEPQSAEGLKREVLIDLNESAIAGRVWNDVKYAKFIKANILGGKSVFVELLRKPMNKAKTRMVKTLAKILIDELNDG